MLLIRDFYPGSRILIYFKLGSRIQQQQQQRRGKICHPSFFVATNITKLKIILFLNRLRQKFEPIYKLKKIATKLSKYGFRIGGKKHIPGPGSRVRIRNTGVT